VDHEANIQQADGGCARDDLEFPVPTAVGEDNTLQDEDKGNNAAPPLFFVSEILVKSTKSRFVLLHSFSMVREGPVIEQYCLEQEYAIGNYEVPIKEGTPLLVVGCILFSLCVWPCTKH
jgi:hypothetical protein